MSTAREQLDVALAIVKEKVNAQSKLYEEQRTYTAMAEDLALQVCMEEKLLQQASWKIEFYRAQTYLKSDTELHHRLAELLQDTHHCGMTVGKDIELRFDDSDVTLCFKSRESAKAFVIDNQLTLVKDDFLIQKAELENKLSEVNSYLAFIAKTETA